MADVSGAPQLLRAERFARDFAYKSVTRPSGVNVNEIERNLVGFLVDLRAQFLPFFHLLSLSLSSSIFQVTCVLEFSVVVVAVAVLILWRRHETHASEALAKLILVCKNRQVDCTRN